MSSNRGVPSIPCPFGVVAEERRLIESALAAMLLCGRLTPYDGMLPDKTACAVNNSITMWISIDPDARVYICHWIFLQRRDGDRTMRKQGAGDTWRQAVDCIMGNAWVQTYG